MIDELAALPQVRGVGETGLDYFRTGPEGMAAQERSFRAHIEIAKRHGKALVIHDREAHDDVLRILREEGAPERVVFHCYSGDAEMAKICADAGYFMSFAGNVTFKNAQPLRDALAVAPPDLLLVETDAPFLTPAPTADGLTPRTSFRSRCGPWPRSRPSPKTHWPPPSRRTPRAPSAIRRAERPPSR